MIPTVILYLIFTLGLSIGDFARDKNITTCAIGRGGGVVCESK